MKQAKKKDFESIYTNKIRRENSRNDLTYPAQVVNFTINESIEFYEHPLVAPQFKHR